MPISKKKPKKSTKKKAKSVRRTDDIILPDEPTISAMSVYDYIIMLYGPPGIGKTEFMRAVSPKTFFISTDRGTRYMKALRREVGDWGSIDGVLKALERRKGSPMYSMVVLDHVDDIATIVEDHTCHELGIDSPGDAEWGKGWKRLKHNLWSIIQRILNLDMGVGLIAHESIKTIRTRVLEYECMMPDLSKSSSKVIVPKCDFVGYAHQKVIRVKGSKKAIERRMILSQPTSGTYAKDRTNRERPEGGLEPLDGELFAATFESTRRTSNVKKKVVKKKVKRRTAR